MSFGTLFGILVAVFDSEWLRWSGRTRVVIHHLGHLIFRSHQINLMLPAPDEKISPESLGMPLLNDLH